MKKQIIACLNVLKSFYRYGNTLSFNIFGINYYGEIVRYKHSFKNKETEVVISFIQEWNGVKDIVFDKPCVVKYIIPDDALRNFVFRGMIQEKVDNVVISQGV